MNDKYFDIQVNGYGGVDFNVDDITVADVELACRTLRRDGVDGILATIVTAQIPLMERRLRNLVKAREASPLAREVIAGLHVEGPFISPVAGYRGAHDELAIRPADLDGAKRLAEACGGLLRLFTLAPEQDEGGKVTKWMAEQGVTVAAGHTDASLDCLKASVDRGLRAFTHLGNGCPMQMHRHDNIIQRALSLYDRLWLCCIADGVHVPFHMLATFLRASGLDRFVIVTDAMAAAGKGPGLYGLGHRQVLVGEDLAAWAPDRSHLVGSAGTMPKTEENLRDKVGLSAQAIRKLTYENPRRAVGLAETAQP